MVSCRAFWVAISYRLSSLHVLSESKVCVELKFVGDRSSTFGTTIITLAGKLQAKMTKNAHKITKNCAKIALFLVYFP